MLNDSAEIQGYW